MKSVLNNRDRFKSITMENAKQNNGPTLTGFHPDTEVWTNNIPANKTFQTNDANQIPVSQQSYPAPNDNLTLCRVCEDVSTGRHYGQITCEGCKSFFKRSIRRKVDYVCRNNRKCKIYREMRNQCQACRFIKCKQVGMKKDAVQTIRSSRSRSPLQLGKELTKLEKISKHSNDEESTTDWDEKNLPNTNLSTKTVLNSILQAENAAPILRVDNFIDQSMGIVCSIVEWSKKLIFCDQMLMGDKLLLIRNSWCQLFLLNYSLCGLSNKLLYHGAAANNSFHAIQSQLLALNRLPMDAVECGCLKAIIFFNPDTRLLFNCSLVDSAQETIQQALENHIKHSSGNKTRFGKLLLKLPYLKEVKVHQILEVFFHNDSEQYANFINELFQRLLTSTKSNGDSDSLDDI